MPTPLHRPAPVDAAGARPVHRDVPPDRAAAALQAGDTLRITDHFRTGVEILAALDARDPAPSESAPFDQRKAHARRRRDTAMRMLVPVVDHRVDLGGATPVGFLAELYPGEARFHLPLVQVQELAGAWQRYEEGVHLAVLGHRLHPYYGTYAPTRTEHLELFAQWLQQHTGDVRRAADVGTGCGVLAFLMARDGAELVLATDQNPNAVESVRRELVRLDPVPPVLPRVGDLLDPVDGPLDLIVFNPPWTVGEADGLVDEALVGPADLLPRFFDQAVDRLAPDGRIVLLWSTIGQLLQPDQPHPIEAELARGRLALVEKLRRKVKPPPGPDGRRRRTKERVEIWELARASGR